MLTNTNQTTMPTPKPKYKYYNLMLCNQRHNISNTGLVMDDSVFPKEIIDLTNVPKIHKMAVNKFKQLLSDKNQRYQINLFVTGCNIALVEVIKVLNDYNVKLCFYHWDRYTKKYYTQFYKRVDWDKDLYYNDIIEV